MSHALQSARRKIDGGHPDNLNYPELKAIDAACHGSFVREIEMLVERATHHNVGLTVQFFDDARGPRLGFSGALSCLQAYVPRYGLTEQVLDELQQRVDAVLQRAAHALSAQQVAS